MKFNYSFWYEKKFIGSMMLANDSVAQEVANGCGANSFKNDITEETFTKCTACHVWHKTTELKEGLCSWCGYLERLKEFINHCESQLDKNWEDREELYKEDFTISYRGKTLILPFGAIEYNNITDCLEQILKENQE
jgi:hypothetical protein